jgi:GNAT superfamily N-acetyltransferase
MQDANHAISFSRETLSESLLEEMKPILEEHYREIAHYQDIPLQPNWKAYWDAHAQNRLRIYIARFHGVMIGYDVVVTQPNAHYETSRQASQDVLYVLKEHRMEGIGRKLVRFTNEQLAAEGVQVMNHHVKVAHPALGHVLETEGFELVEYIYSKRLDKPMLPPTQSEHMANIQAWEEAQ